MKKITFAFAFALLSAQAPLGRAQISPLLMGQSYHNSKWSNISRYPNQVTTSFA